MGRQSRDKNDTEHLRGIIRQLKSENRYLKKQLSRANKEYKKIESVIDLDHYEDEPAVKANPSSLCPICNSDINYIDLVTRVVYHCTNKTCSYRRVTK